MFCTRKSPLRLNALGWFLPVPFFFLATTKNCHVNFVKINNSLPRDINRSWESNFGCNTSLLDVPSSREDRVVCDLMRRFVSIVEGHYQLPLPNVTSSGDRLATARQRLDSLYKRLKRDDTLRQKYAEVIETYLKNNYAIVVPQMN